MQSAQKEPKVISYHLSIPPGSLYDCDKCKGGTGPEIRMNQIELQLEKRDYLQAHCKMTSLDHLSIKPTNRFNV